MSGRALGHTGGTVDKLESIPGYKTELEPDEFMSQSKKIGLELVGQSGHLAPADKTMYALRDVTSTVDSIPLIASSIMSKKLAAGAHNIVLDVKFGSGAFMHGLEDATKLARAMVDIGKRCGRRVRAVISDMDKPLGNAIGNVLEVREAIDVLRGEGPDDLREVSVTLAGVLISLVRNISTDEGITLAREALASGAAYNKFKEWIGAQGGDLRYITAPELFGEAPVCTLVKAEASGYISRMNTEKIGLTSSKLGAGREKKGDTIDPLAGIMLRKKTGDKVEKGEVVAVLYTSSPELAAQGVENFSVAYEIAKEKPASRELISEII
jgi:pyrimidine-nucleoside phosphorylase